MSSYVDLSDSIQYLGRNQSITGIQRVVFSAIQGGLSPCIVDWQTGRVYSFRDERLASYNFVRFICAQYKITTLEEFLFTFKNELNEISPSGDQLFFLGGFWNFRGCADVMSFLSARFKVGVFVHDMLPFVRSDFFDDTTEFVRSYCALQDKKLIFLTSTSYSSRLIQANLNFSSTFVVPFPSEFVLVDQKVSPIGGLEHIEHRKSVLLIGTFEVRKKLSAVLEAWIDNEAFLRSDLFIVGSAKGQLGANFLNIVEKINARIPNIVPLVEVSDLLLYRLYRNASYVVYPSYEEGWGLPISEACYFGKWTFVPENSCLLEWHNSARPFSFSNFSHSDMLSEIQKAGPPTRNNSSTWAQFVTDCIITLDKN